MTNDSLMKVKTIAGCSFIKLQLVLKTNFHSFLEWLLYTSFTVYQNSQFLFRYVEEHVQRTGVAIETQGFAFITSGKKRESLTVSVASTILVSWNVYEPLHVAFWHV